MYEVSVQEHFDAAHYLRGYQGKCENVHGHRFEVIVSLKATQTDNVGLAYDFVQLREQLKKVLGRFDHVCLNDISPFDNINPSSENIATTIYDELKQKLHGTTVSIADVEVWESPHQGIIYIPD